MANTVFNAARSRAIYGQPTFGVTTNPCSLFVRRVRTLRAFVGGPAHGELIVDPENPNPKVLYIRRPKDRFEYQWPPDRMTPADIVVPQFETAEYHYNMHTMHINEEVELRFFLWEGMARDPEELRRATWEVLLNEAGCTG